MFRLCAIIIFIACTTSSRALADPPPEIWNPAAIPACLLHAEERDSCIVGIILDATQAMPPEKRQKYLRSWAGDIANHGTQAQRETTLERIEENGAQKTGIDEQRMLLLLSLGKIEAVLEEIKRLSGTPSVTASTHLPQENAISFLVRHDKIDDAVRLYKETQGLPNKSVSLTFGHDDFADQAPLKIVAGLLLDHRLEDAKEFADNIDSDNVFQSKKADAEAYINRFEAFEKNPQTEAAAFFEKQDSYFDFLMEQQKRAAKNAIDLDKISTMDTEYKEKELQKFKDATMKDRKYDMSSFYRQLFFAPQTPSGYKLTWELFMDQCIGEMRGASEANDIECLRRALTHKRDKIYGGVETFLLPRYAEVAGVKIPDSIWRHY